VDKPHNSQERPCYKALDSSTEPNPGKYAENGEFHFLLAQPTPAIPHCTSPLMFAQILAKRHCYNKQLRTCHIDGPFRDILAAGRRGTTKVLEFLSALKLRL